MRLLEETPRDRLLEEVADRIRRGVSYQELLAALLLAGVKNVEPRPSVGFKFHTVLVVNSAHLASMASPPEHRWLPIFWALDYYKSAAARDVEERGDWTMSAVDESALPPAHRARRAFRRGDGQLGRRRRRCRDRRPGPHRRRERNLRNAVPLRRARLPLHRPQGDLRRQQLPHAAVHRLAARRAGAALAGLCAVDARRRQPGPARR